MIVGKTNTPEFGTVAFTESELNGATRNPWNTELTPGGSSGGAAAAVSRRARPDRARARDGGGSIRIPASCCGLFGLKPSRGRVSSAPFSSLEGLSTAGPMARTVEDAAHFLDVLAGYEPGDPWWAPPPERPFAETTAETPPGRLRIAVTSTPPIDVAGRSRVRRQRSRPPPSSSPSSGTTSARRRRPGASPTSSTSFIAVWQVGPALHPVDEALMTPLNRGLVESARASIGSRLRADASPSCRCSPAGSSSFWSDVDVVADADARAPTGADRLAGRGRRRDRAAPAATPSSRRSPPSRTSRGSRRCRSRSTGATPASRSASRRSARPPATRSCSASQRRSRRRGHGRTGVRRPRSRLSRAIVMRISCPGEACSMRAALPREIASDMFL